MIEKIIHQIWYQGEDKCPEKFKSGIESWKINHPDWHYMFWDENKMKSLIQQDYSEYYESWQNFNYMHQRIDFFKYILMDKYGGCYADIDSTSLKTINPLLKYDGVVVSGMPASILSYTNAIGTINNGIILSSKGHPFWRWYMEKILLQCDKTWLSKFTEIENTTGPAFFSECIMEYKGDGITVLNHKTFEPCIGADSYCIPGEESYVNHQHAQTWIPDFLKITTKIYVVICHYWYFVIIFIIIFLFFMIKWTGLFHS
jgi:mannosyltransferase OCH1-like enzyme